MPLVRENAQYPLIRKPPPKSPNGLDPKALEQVRKETKKGGRRRKSHRRKHRKTRRKY
jgi:hypothetical protein